ncbi:hypothetical protein CK203_114607 [Vitis vinifera]|uniref:Uncharacterized protein n=1 Tax=Vitis vinifera TaxID=29760 RepID=A0A438FEB4_VITVI|nr:hypothetical protein CK203_114607 [Vitis vinifera]
MGLGGNDVKVESWEVGKSKGRKKKDGGEEETGCCWVKLRFMASCISSRSKVDSSISGTSTHYVCGGGKWGLDELGACGARLPLKIYKAYR